MQNWTDVFFTSRDGLRLHARHYPAPGSRRRPVVCLPALTRNGRDFHDLACVLADPRGHRRDVLAIDCRGRGLSERAEDWNSYTVLAELADTLDAMAIVGLRDAAVIGTGRGGLVAMAMAAMRPGAIGAAILNDFGPVIERDGLARSVAFVGRVPLPRTWQEATALVKSLEQRTFPDETETTWASLARQIFNDESGRPASAYDPALSKAVALTDGPIEPMWTQFSALQRLPILALRGANSDVLSAETLNEMRRRHQHLEAYTVPNQGHAPLLKDSDTIGLIYQFLMNNDAVEPVVSGRGDRFARV